MIGSEGVSTSRDLNKRSAMDPAIICRALRSLEKSGLVELARSESDRRVLQVHLTASGSRLHEQMFSKMKARQKRLLKSLAPDEATAFIQIIYKLERAAKSADDES